MQQIFKIKLACQDGGHQSKQYKITNKISSRCIFISFHKSYHQYSWVISSVPVRICSTCELYPKYPCGYAVSLSNIGQLWKSFRNKVSQARHKDTKMIQKLSLLYIWGRVLLWQCWMDWRWRQSISQLLLIQVRTVSSQWQAAKSINYEISKETFYFLTFFTMNSLSTLENLPF